VGLIRGLRGHGLQVSSVAAKRYFNSDGEDPPRDLSLHVIRLNTNWRSRLRHYAPRPWGGIAYGEFKQYVDKVCAAADVMHLEEVEATWCDLNLRLPAAARIHNRVRLDQSVGWPWTRQFRGHLARSLGERAAMRRHRWLVANSPIVAQTLRVEAPHAEVVLAPVCLDPADYLVAPLNGPPIVGIIGTATWPPTASAIRRLISTVWPQVHRRVPGARLLIAGWKTDLLKEVAGPGIDLLGPVASAREFFRGLSVLLYPLERGSGMKVKVLESLAMGLPVVTTAAGAEGVEAEGGAVIEAEDNRLAAATAQILIDSQERRQRGAAARSAFEKRYSPSPATEPLVDLYKRMS
jgi:glycosyltransferase involved in cell wall biosynthesis